MKFTIEDLRNGRCAVRNDGTLEQLHKVLRKAFPNDGSKVRGVSRYYIAVENGLWEGDSFIHNLPAQSVKDFLQEEEATTQTITITVKRVKGQMELLIESDMSDTYEMIGILETVKHNLIKESYA